VAGDTPAEVLESGPAPRRWRRPSRPVTVLTIVTLLVGALAGGIAGYLIGRSGSSTQTPAATPPADTGVGSISAVAPTGERCSAQHGRVLQLGVQVVNTANNPVVLRRLDAFMPLRGLRAVGAGWDTCGAIGPVSAPQAVTVSPGATAWATVRLRVLVGCPVPYPVELRLHYSQSGTDRATPIDEFPDLSHVAYTGCITLH
jgi:hypothetical protein